MVEEAHRRWGPPAFRPYQNCIKRPSETGIGVVRRAKSRFPRLLERLRKRETEWTVWKGTSRAQGRCATRLRYAPTDDSSLILNHFSPNIHPEKPVLSLKNSSKLCEKRVIGRTKIIHFLGLPIDLFQGSRFICNFICEFLCRPSHRLDDMLKTRRRCERPDLSPAGGLCLPLSSAFLSTRAPSIHRRLAYTARLLRRRPFVAGPPGPATQYKFVDPTRPALAAPSTPASRTGYFPAHVASAILLSHCFSRATTFSPIDSVSPVSPPCVVTATSISYPYAPVVRPCGPAPRARLSSA